jgi:hypothetical protein
MSWPCCLPTLPHTPVPAPAAGLSWRSGPCAGSCPRDFADAPDGFVQSANLGRRNRRGRCWSPAIAPRSPWVSPLPMCASRCRCYRRRPRRERRAKSSSRQGCARGHAVQRSGEIVEWRRASIRVVSNFSRSARLLSAAITLIPRAERPIPARLRTAWRDCFGVSRPQTGKPRRADCTRRDAGRGAVDHPIKYRRGGGRSANRRREIKPKLLEGCRPIWTN